MSTWEPQVQQAHEFPFIRQFSIFLPNRVGQLHELLAVLEAAEVELVGISVVDSTEWAVVRMIFADVGKARQILRRHGAAFTESPALAVVVGEEHTLRQVCKTLVGAELNLHYAYPLMIRREQLPVMVLHVDDEVLAAQVLSKRGFKLLDHEDV